MLDQNQIYRMGGAAGAGLVLTQVRKKMTGAPLFDIIFAAGVGALGILGGASLRGTTLDFATGAVDGAAAYVGSRIPDILGAAGTSKQIHSYLAASRPAVSYSPSYSPAVSYSPNNYIGNKSVVEI